MKYPNYVCMLKDNVTKQLWECMGIHIYRVFIFKCKSPVLNDFLTTALHTSTEEITMSCYLLNIVMLSWDFVTLIH